MRVLESIAGALMAAVLLVGVLFKTMHWPGAGIMIVFGSCFLSIYVIAVAGLIKFSPLKPREKFGLFGSKKAILAMSISILIVALLFKSMHWPGAGPMLVVGFSSLAIVCLFYMFAFIFKKEEFKVTPPLFFITIGLCAIFFGVSVSGVSGFVIRGISDNAVGLESISKSVYSQNSTLILSDSSRYNQEVFNETTELSNHIKEVKSKLYEIVDQLPKEMADTISLSGVMFKDNYDIPTLLMGLADPRNPSKNAGEETYSALTLREKIEDFNSLIGNAETEVSAINISDSYNFEGKIEPWEVSTFYHAPLAFVVLSLNRIELEANIICNTILTTNLLKQTNIQQPDTIN